MNDDKFCVYITTYHGDRLPPKYTDSLTTPYLYVGYTTVGNIKSGYIGSVSSEKYKYLWEEERKVNKRTRELFTVEIISLHETRQEAVAAESSLQRKLDVLKSEKYINMHIGGDEFFNEWDDARRENFSNLMKDVWLRKSEEDKLATIKALASGNIFRNGDENAIAKWKESINLAWEDDARRESLSERNREQWANPEYKLKVSSSIKNTYTQSQKDFTTERNNIMWADPEYSDWLRSRMKESYTDEVRKERSNRIKELANREEVRVLKSLYKTLKINQPLAVHLQSTEWLCDKIVELQGTIKHQSEIPAANDCNPSNSSV